MTEHKEDKVVGIMKLVIIACAVVLMITWIPGLIGDYKYKAERKARMELWEKNGISPVIRGQGVRDTFKIDTTKCLK